MLHYIFALFFVLLSHSSIFTAFAEVKYKSQYLDQERSSIHSRHENDDRRREYQEKREEQSRLEELREEEEKRKEQRQKEIEYRQELERRREAERQRNEVCCANTIDKEEEEYRKRREEEYEERQRQEELEKKDQEERDERYWEEREELKKLQRKIEQEKEQQRIHLEQALAAEDAKKAQVAATIASSPSISENISIESDSSKQLHNEANNNSSTLNVVIDIQKDDDEEIEKSKYKKLIKKSFIKGLSSELLAYDIYIDIPPSCVYIPAKNDNPAYVYVPSFNDNPCYVYVPAHNGNQACIYVASQEDKEKLMLASVPTILFGGGTIGSGFLSGGTIPIVVGSGILIGKGIKEIVRFLKEKKEKKNNSGGGGGSGDNNNKKNDDDDEEKKRKQKEAEKFKIEHPNGKYDEGSKPKHHQNARGNTGKAPQNGQKILDESIGTDTEKWRVGIENGKFVIFERTSEGVYHGYVIENPGNMHQSIKNAVYNAGWVKAINNLKIIKK